ncbi:hypothetical protein NKH98_28370 [Mesorhizobium sp. M0833]|uniref:hypothetical protein n=1 Tax=Mesorhizobium sp. M0833 TaxID=2957009 RepID=UPI00333AB8BF
MLRYQPAPRQYFLHCILDLWAYQWRRRVHMVALVVRYADDFVMGFENKADAEEMLLAPQSAAGRLRPDAP